LPEDTDNGSNYVAIKAPDTIASNLTLTLPSADGSSGQVLQTNGSGVLSFAGVSASAGQVIQVITATDDTTRSTTSTSFVTGSNTLSVSITPASASNKIFIVANVNSGDADSGAERHFTIQRGATNLGNTSGLAQGRTSGGLGFSMNVNMAVLDSPSTTSATTYQVYMKSPNGTARMNENSCRGTITCFEIKG
jgi:hypothetical protein